MASKIGNLWQQQGMFLQINYNPVLPKSTNVSSSFYISIFPLPLISSWDISPHCNERSMERKGFFALWDCVGILHGRVIRDCVNLSGK